MDLCKKYFKRFFLTGELAEKYVLIEWNQINRRCILTDLCDCLNKKKIMLSPCGDLNEHD